MLGLENAICHVSNRHELTEYYCLRVYNVTVTVVVIIVVYSNKWLDNCGLRTNVPKIIKRGTVAR